MKKLIITDEDGMTVKIEGWSHIEIIGIANLLRTKCTVEMLKIVKPKEDKPKPTDEQKKDL